jgi:phosphoglycolate phosphatase
MTTSRLPGGMPRAVLFDLDGTLADTLPDIALTLDQARRAVGLEPVADPVRVRGWVGSGARLLVARSLGTDDPRAPEVERLLAAFRRIYPEHSGRLGDLYPGIRALLADLRARGVPLALVTNKPREATGAFLKRRDIDGALDVWLTPDDVDDRPKPDPAMLLEAARRLGVPPAACLLVGDGLADVGAARAAGLPVLAVLGGYTQPAALRAAGADACVERAADLAGLLAAETT